MKRRSFLKGLAAIIPGAMVIKSTGAAENIPEKTVDKPEEPAKIESKTEGSAVSKKNCLKADRVETTVLNPFCNHTIKRGEIVSAAPDVYGEMVVQPYDSNLPVQGVALQDVVELDLTRQSIFEHKDSVQQGGKVSVLSHGSLRIGPFEGVLKPGDPLYVNDDGHLTSEENNRAIGVALSSPDDDGFAAVKISV